jgi:hypothetical protein
MHWPSYFAPLIAFGGRFDVTGLIPADQYHRRMGHGFRQNWKILFWGYFRALFYE